MSQKKKVIFYLSMLLLGIAVVVGISLQPGAIQVAESRGGLTDSLVNNFHTFVGFVKEHIASSFGLLLLQTIVILIFARMVAWVFTKIGQPSVIGEILAGIILGPSVLGLFFPSAYSSLFPVESLHNISLLSQFGLIFFMFVIGMELDLGDIKKNFQKAFIISHTSIIIPFIMGAVLALFLYHDYAGAHSQLLTFALFIGVSMSITAFPVLARIIQEQGKMNTHIGIISMSSAANGDITAWCIVAVIMAIAQAGAPMSALFTVLFAAAYMLIMFYVVKPLFKIIGKAYNNKEVANLGLIALIFLTLLVSSYVTEVLGLHALFGAFIAGVVMPEDVNFRRIMTEKVEDVSLSVFLPLFFVSSGLQTEIGLLNTPTHWWITLIIITVAIAGKLVGTYVSCRVVGESRRDSLYIGILMNTRGLMELVVLSMGYQLGILSPVIYAMLVIMTLVTTFITTPLIDLTNRLWKEEKTEIIRDAYRIVFSFGRTTTGMLILNILDTFFPQKTTTIEVTGLHMTVGTDVSPLQAEHFREESFRPLHQLNKRTGHDIIERYEVTDSPVNTMVRVSKETLADLFFFGASLDFSDLPQDKQLRSLHRKYKSRLGIPLSTTTALFNVASLLRDRSDEIIRQMPCSIGIVIDRHLSAPARSILIVEDSALPNSSCYLNLVRALIGRVQSDCHEVSLSAITINNHSPALSGVTPIDSHRLTPELLRKHDLMIMSYATWQVIIEQEIDLLAIIPTTLLLHARECENISKIYESTDIIE